MFMLILVVTYPLPIKPSSKIMLPKDMPRYSFLQWA